MRILPLALLVACSAPPDVDDPDAQGPYAVGHTQITVASVGDRVLPVELWWPAEPGAVSDLPLTSYVLQDPIALPSTVAYVEAPVAEGAFPLLVFSHGYQSIATQSTALMEALASHGFVVASPEHVGNSQASPDDDFDTAAGHRVPDISAVIDALEGSEWVGAQLSGEVGVLGHSFGGMTAVGVAAGWAGAPADPRVDAILPISAVIDGDLQADDRASDSSGFTSDQLASVTQPVLLLGGTEDAVVPVENNRIAFDELTSAEVVVRVDVEGANHTHFANICDIASLLIGMGIQPDAWPALGAGALIEPYEATCTEGVFPIAEAQRLQSRFAVAFFRRHLYGDEEYGWYLRSARGEAAVTLWRRP